MTTLLDDLLELGYDEAEARAMAAQAPDLPILKAVGKTPFKQYITTTGEVPECVTFTPPEDKLYIKSA